MLFFWWLTIKPCYKISKNPLRMFIGVRKCIEFHLIPWEIAQSSSHYCGWRSFHSYSWFSKDFTRAFKWDIICFLISMGRLSKLLKCFSENQPCVIKSWWVYVKWKNMPQKVLYQKSWEWGHFVPIIQPGFNPDLTLPRCFTINVALVVEILW